MRPSCPRSLLGVVGVVLVTGTLGGCSWIFGGDGVSPELARSMALALSGAAGSAAEDPATAAGGAMVTDEAPDVDFRSSTRVRAATTENFDIDNAEDCEVSGTVRVDGSGTATVDTTGGTETYTSEFQGEFRLDQCGARMNDGRVVTMTTTSPLEFSLTSEYVRSTTPRLSYSLDYTGSFEWDVEDGPSGTCELDIHMDTSADGGTVEGAVCGHDITASGLGG